MAGGLIGYAFLHGTAILLNLSLRHQAGWQLPRLDEVRLGWWLVPEAAAGAVIVSVLARRQPAIQGHGIPEAMEAVLVNQIRIGVGTAVAKPVASVVAIGTGAPFGAEGPIILTGGAIGSLLGQAVRVSPAERKVLLAAGASAGMAAIFGAPIGAVLLAIELLLFEFSPRVLVPIVVASVFADGVHLLLLLGRGPLFAVPPHDFAGLARLPFYVILGVACGILAVVITAGAFGAEDVFARLPVPRFWHPVLGAVVVSLIGLAVPETLAVGYDVIGRTLGDPGSSARLLALSAAKLASWCVAIGSGTSGSSLAPLLLIGSSAGGALGSLLHAMLPGAAVSPGAFSLVGMAATFGAAAGAPFTAVVLAFEITRDYNVILPLMLSTVVAHLLARSIQPQTLMTEKLARAGVRVSQRYEMDLQRVTEVGAVMSPATGPVDTAATVGDIRDLLRDSGRHALTVTDGDRVVGIVTEGDIIRRRLPDSATVGMVASRPVSYVTPTTTVFEAVHRLLDEEVRQFPVLQDGKLRGMFSRLDALRVNELEIEREESQTGWFRRRRAVHPRRSGPSADHSG